MRCDHRAHLRTEFRRRAEQLGEILRQPLRVLVGLGVVDEPSIDAHRAALAHQLDQPLDSAPTRPYPLDSPELGFDHQDRFEIECRAEPCRRATDTPTAPQILKCVDEQPLSDLLARPARVASTTPEASSPAAAARAAATAWTPRWPAAPAESITRTRSPPLPSSCAAAWRAIE